MSLQVGSKVIITDKREHYYQSLGTIEHIRGSKFHVSVKDSHPDTPSECGLMQITLREGQFKEHLGRKPGERAD